jgi:hypothetical protein
MTSTKRHTLSCDCWTCANKRNSAASAAHMVSLRSAAQAQLRVVNQEAASPAKVQAGPKVIVRRYDGEGRIILRRVPKASKAQRLSQRKKRTVYAEVTGTFAGPGRPGHNRGWAAIKV